MAIRNFPGLPTSVARSNQTGLSGASTGNKASSTVPAGEQWVVRFVAFVQTAGAALITVRTTIAGTTVRILKSTTDGALAPNLVLEPGNTIFVNVDTADAASLFDYQMNAEVYPIT